MKTATGEWIWFVDSDDAIIPNALEKLHKATQTAREGGDAIHLKGWYTTEQDDDKPLDVKQIRLNWEGNPNVGFLTEDIPRRLFENWVSIRINGYTWNTIYKRKFLEINNIKFLEDCYSEDNIFHLMCMCVAKKYLMIRDAINIYRVHSSSYMHKAKIRLGVRSLPVAAIRTKNFLDTIPSLNGNRILKEQCIIQILEAHLRDHARPLYNGANTPIELDNAVYETLLPIFGENTTLVKHLFHGYNNMWRQAQIFAGQRNYLAQQNHLLQQKLDALTAQQKNLNTQLEEILKELFGSVN